MVNLSLYFHSRVATSSVLLDSATLSNVLSKRHTFTFFSSSISTCCMLCDLGWLQLAENKSQKSLPWWVVHSLHRCFKSCCNGLSLRRAFLDSILLRDLKLVFCYVALCASWPVLFLCEVLGFWVLQLVTCQCRECCESHLSIPTFPLLA